FRECFYGDVEKVSVDHGEAWSAWVANWKALGPKVAKMLTSNPMYIPREWMLFGAYDAAEKGDFAEIDNLQRLFEDPYSKETSEKSATDKESYYSKTPLSMRNKG